MSLPAMEACEDLESLISEIEEAESKPIPDVVEDEISDDEDDAIDDVIDDDDDDL
jgi:hypothetical protein